MPEGSAARCLRPKDAGTEADPTIRLHFLSSLNGAVFPTAHAAFRTALVVIGVASADLLRYSCGEPLASLAYVFATLASMATSAIYLRTRATPSVGPFD